MFKILPFLISFNVFCLNVTIDFNKKIKLLDIENKIKKQSYQYEYEYTYYKIDGVQNEISMKEIPVSDQGQEGTCITFSTVDAINYYLKSDISKQCLLSRILDLGSDLWDGAFFASQVYSPLTAFGAILEKDCKYKYPDRLVKISENEYKNKIDYLTSKRLFDIGYTYYKQNDLNALKSSILGRKLVLVSFLLNPQNLEGVRGYSFLKKDGKYSTGGLYACWQYTRPYSYNCGGFRAGHAVIVIGFDDRQKLLKIRNSWGTQFGEDGDFYMTYEFFKSQVQDMTTVELLK